MIGYNTQHIEHTQTFQQLTTSYHLGRVSLQHPGRLFKIPNVRESQLNCEYSLTEQNMKQD